MASGPIICVSFTNSIDQPEAKGYRAANESLVVIHQAGYYRMNEGKEKKKNGEGKVKETERREKGAVEYFTSKANKSFR